MFSLPPSPVIYSSVSQFHKLKGGDVPFSYSRRAITAMPSPVIIVITVFIILRAAFRLLRVSFTV